MPRSPAIYLLNRVASMAPSIFNYSDIKPLFSKYKRSSVDTRVFRWHLSDIIYHYWNWKLSASENILYIWNEFISAWKSERGIKTLRIHLSELWMNTNWNHDLSRCILPEIFTITAIQRDRDSAMSGVFLNNREKKAWISNHIHVNYGPLARCVKLWVAHAPGMPERFPRHHGLAIPTCTMARAWRTCRDTCRDR